MVRFRNFVINNMAVGRSLVYHSPYSHEIRDSWGGVIQSGVLCVGFFILSFFFIIIFIYFGKRPIFNTIAAWLSGIYGDS